jgi:hypothetical protein
LESVSRQQSALSSKLALKTCNCKFLTTESPAANLIRAAASFEDKSAAAPKQKVLLQSVLLQVLRTKGKA